MTMVGTQAPRTLFGDIPAAECADTGDGDAEYYCGDAELCGFGGDTECAERAEGYRVAAAWARVRLRIRRDSSSKMWGRAGEDALSVDEVLWAAVDRMRIMTRWLRGGGRTCPTGTYLPKKFGTTTHEPNRWWSSNQSRWICTIGGAGAARCSGERRRLLCTV